MKRKPKTRISDSLKRIRLVEYITILISINISLISFCFLEEYHIKYISSEITAEEYGVVDEILDKYPNITNSISLFDDKKIDRHEYEMLLDMVNKDNEKKN